MWLNVYIDSKHGFLVLHVPIAVWKERQILTEKNILNKYSSEFYFFCKPSGDSYG